MYEKIRSFLVLACLFQECLFDTRGDIVAQYQPILTEISANFTDQYGTAKTETQLLENQIQNTLNGAVSLVDSQINTLNSTIATAKTLCAKNSAALSCLSVEEISLAKTSALSMNARCWDEQNFANLTDTTEIFETLAQISNDTVAACSTLYPFTNEDDLFEDCLVDKILDLNHQHDLLVGNFELVKEQTLNSSVQCLADQSAAVGSQISQINYQVTLCITLNSC